ncbi:MAG: hypothetical protein AAF353_12860 [Pseudomonadota bacterium]
MQESPEIDHHDSTELTISQTAAANVLKGDILQSRVILLPTKGRLIAEECRKINAAIPGLEAKPDTIGQ